MPDSQDPEKQPAPPTVAWDPSEVEAGHQGVDPDDPLVGSLIREKWRVLSRIGAGSFGTVYKVRDETGGWIEALKILRVDRLRGPEGEATRARFLREARIMKRLGSKSRHIVRLSTYEEDLEAGLIYFLMEHVEGHNLAEVLDRDGPFPIERVVDVTLQVCDALIAAHESEPPVVHRDLKLQNLMLTGDDDGACRVMVLDFGIAKIAAAELDSRLTTTGAIGTPGYASPEQIRAESVDGRTDLFALGVIMYALLTARDPWLGNLAHEPTDQVYRLMAATDRGEVLPMEEWRPDVPPTLVQIVKRLLRREADERFQSARELRDALLEFAGINTRDFPAYSTRDRLPPMPKGSGGDTIPERRLAAVWFADLVGYSSLSATDEGAALALLDTFHATARKVIEAGGGRVVQFIGDAAFAEFSSTERAVRTAVRFHEEFALATEENDPRPRLRTGVHVGDVLMASNGDLFGDGVNVASRIQNEAEPGQILVSQDVWRQLKQRRDFHFASVGERSLKGLGSPVWLFAVVPPDEADRDTGDTGALHTDSPMVAPQARKGRAAHIAGVAVAHLTASGAMLYASTVLESRFGLPDWITPVAGILLAVGLVLVLVTSWMQTRPTWERPVSSHGPWSLDLPDVFRSLASGKLPELTWARTIAGGLAAFTTLFAVASFTTTPTTPSRVTPSAPTAATAAGGAGLAILPFRVEGADNALAEGIPDLMAFTAADAGIATTPGLVLRRRLSGTVPANIEEVGRVARAVQSRFAIMGEARESDGTLSLSARLLDARTGEQVRTASGEGPTAQLGSLVAGLTAELLESTPLDTRDGEMDTAPPSESAEALRAYMEGEQSLRSAEWSGAVAAFARARDADPQFALALGRLAFARALASAPGAHVRDADAARALELADDLPARDQRIVQGLVLLAEGSGDAIGILDDLTRAYPSDPDAWYLLGDALYHIEGPEGNEYAGAFEQSIELAGSYEPAYAHLIAAAIARRDLERAEELMAELRADHPGSVFLAQFEEPMRAAAAPQSRPETDRGTNGSSAAVRTEPSPSPPAADPFAGVRTAYGQLTGSVEAERSRVLALDPHPALSSRLGEVDGLRTRAEAAAAANDFDTAVALQEQARAAYAEIARDAAILDRYSGDLAALAPLRSGARDPDRQSEAERLEQDAARAVTQGRYSEAVTLVGRARTAWLRAAEAPAVQSTPPAAPARPAPRVVADDVLARLAAAIEAEDMNRVRSVWTSISAEEAEGLAGLFSSASDIEVAYDVQSVADQGSRVVASVHTTYRFNLRGSQTAETNQVFELEERNGVWVVVASR